MDKNQMEMLSVKNAIERMVQNYINTYSTNGTPEGFFGDVERMVASFFVGQQIDNTYLVRSGRLGDLEISFSTHRHCTRLTFMLPETLQWKIQKQKTTATGAELVPGDVSFSKHEKALSTTSFGDITLKKQEWLSDAASSPKTEQAPEEFDPVEAYDRAKKAVRNMS